MILVCSKVANHGRAHTGSAVNADFGRRERRGLEGWSVQLPVAGARLTPLTCLLTAFLPEPPPPAPYSGFCPPRNPGHPSPAASCPGSAGLPLGLAGHQKRPPPSLPSEQVSWAAHESEGAAAQLGSSLEIDPWPPPPPRPGICSGEKQAFQSGRLTGRRWEEAPSPLRRVDPGLGPAQIRSDPPRAGPVLQ